MKAKTCKNKNWSEGQDSKTGLLSCLIADCRLGGALPSLSHLICWVLRNKSRKGKKGGRRVCGFMPPKNSRLRQRKDKHLLSAMC